MRKSKSSSKRRDRSRSRSDDSKSKRAKPRSRSREKPKTKQNSKSAPRKTRWEADSKKDSNKKAQTSGAAAKTERSGPPPRIKDFLHDKEKIVDLLFQTVTGAALEELIPDYLKKRPAEELKKLCLEQIKTMSDEVILETISGKLESSNKDEEKVAQKEEILKPEQSSAPEENPQQKEVNRDSEKKPNIVSTEKVEEKPSDNLPKPSLSEESAKERGVQEESQIPVVIKEVAKDLIQPERDAELLELEMRARAIRSLLKAKSQQANEEAAIKD